MVVVVMTRELTVVLRVNNSSKVSGGGRVTGELIGISSKGNQWW